ncbi:MAG: LON peptidase substrate-binding domain-containing protein, partial [Myxococcota bacterium]
AVFPLPHTVLYPGTVLPLRVCEKPYCDLVNDALAGDSSIAVVLRKMGEAQGGASPLHAVAGAGRIIHAEKLEGGHFNILVHGLHRVRLVEELPRERSYRRFRSEVIPAPDRAQLAAAGGELARLQSCVLSLRSAVAETDAQLVEVLRSTADPLELADILAATLVSEPEVQQTLLAAGELRVRLSRLIDLLADVMVRIGAPPRTAQLN